MRRLEISGARSSTNGCLQTSIPWSSCLATYIAQWLQSFREFPQRKKPGSFNLDRIMESITSGAAQNGSN